MPSREASCSCGQLRLRAEGDPTKVAMCHCLACQRRTGSAFGVQARFPSDQVQVSGESSEYARTSEEGTVHLYHFCPHCGATVFYRDEGQPEVTKVPVGAFADPSFPPPTSSIYESRRHPWISVPEEAERSD